jgi:putative ABC transport system permease protein
MTRVIRAALLRAFPRSFRVRFGVDLSDAMDDRLRAARARGVTTLAVAWLRAAADLIAHGLAERRAERRRAGPHERRRFMLHTFSHDVRYAIRTFRARPAFTAVALVTLALGIGANTAIFSVVHAVMLRDLPYPDADRIALVYATHGTDFDHGVMNPFDVAYIGERTTAFSALAATRAGSTTLTGAGKPARLRLNRVEPAFFDVMATRPALGRAFTRAEARDSEPVVVISHGLWTTRFGRDPDIIDRTVMLDDEPWRVVGVMPSGFAYPERVDFWLPLALTDADRASMNSWFLGTIGRLRPAVTREAARRELDRLAADLEAAYPQHRQDRGFNLVGLQEDLALRSAEGLTLLQGVVLFVLLIACANVANLLLAQATARQREFAVRAAVGGSRARLVRQALTESVVLASAGAALGVVLAVWGVRWLVALAPDRLLPHAESIGVSWPVLAITALVAAGTGILFGLAPALLVSAPASARALRDGGRSAASALGWSRRNWPRSGLVAAEVALALVLLTGAGLLARSFTHLLAQPPGFRAEGVLTAQVTLPATRYPDAGTRLAFWTDLIDRLDGLPGVTNAGGSTALPFTFWEWQTGFVIRGREDAPGATSVRTITPSLFDALGIPVLAGRRFTAADTPESEAVVIVSDAFAREHLPGLNPVGQQLGFSISNPQFATIVGVVGATRHLGLDEAPRAEVYRPLAQAPATSTFLLAVHTTGDPARLADPVREAVGALDPALPVEEVKTMDALIGVRLAERRFYLTLLGLFATLAAALAATGIYGVMANVVSQGRREIGIRLALGARAGQVRARLVRQGLVVVAIGAGAGFLMARGLSGIVPLDLFEITMTDMPTYVVAAGALVAITAIACWLPTRRAAAVNPVEVLKD